MNTKINFVNRNELKTNNDNPKKVDAQKIIDYYLSLHPSNRLIVNSPLYNLATQQYNENIKNTLVRPDVPEWFCGKVNPDTGELINKPTDQQLRASAGVISDPLPNIIATPEGIQGSYLVDECLEVGTPGSSPYTKCDTGIDARDAQDSVDEWLSSMESVNEELEALVALAEEEAASADNSTKEHKKSGSSVFYNPTMYGIELTRDLVKGEKSIPEVAREVVLAPAKEINRIFDKLF